MDATDERATQHLERLATETIDDWHTAARDLGVRTRALDLIQAAESPEGLAHPDKLALASLYTSAAGRPSLELTAVDLAGRLRPLVRASIEAELLDLGTWPLPRGTPLGLYARALVGAWRESSAASPPTTCATPGCSRPVPTTQNRLYCDTCQLDRKRDDLRRRRAAEAASVASGPGATE